MQLLSSTWYGGNWQVALGKCRSTTGPSCKYFENSNLSLVAPGPGDQVTWYGVKISLARPNRKFFSQLPGRGKAGGGG